MSGASSLGEFEDDTGNDVSQGGSTLCQDGEEGAGQRRDQDNEDRSDLEGSD